MPASRGLTIRLPTAFSVARSPSHDPPEPRLAAFRCRAPRHRQGGSVMHIDRVQADRTFAFLGFALSFLFLLGVVAFAFTVGGDTNTPQPSALVGAEAR